MFMSLRYPWRNKKRKHRFISRTLFFPSYRFHELPLLDHTFTSPFNTQFHAPLEKYAQLMRYSKKKKTGGVITELLKLLKRNFGLTTSSFEKTLSFIFYKVDNFMYMRLILLLVGYPFSQTWNFKFPSGNGSASLPGV